MFLKSLFITLSTVLLALSITHPSPQVSAWLGGGGGGGGGIGDWIDDAADAGSGIIDDVVSIGDDIVDGFEDFANSVASAFTSLANAVTGVAISSVSWLYELSQESGFTLEAMYAIQELAEDIIDIVLPGFNETTWEKLSKGAKYVLYELEEFVDDTGIEGKYIKEYIAKGANFLTELTDLDDYVPFPFNVIKQNDFYTVTDCIDDDVLEAAIDFAENVATTIVDLGSDFSVTPIFNTENIAKELNNTYECLVDLAKDLKKRKENEDEDQNILADLLDDALEWMEFNDVIIGLEIAFTACTLVCGSASIGFAVDPDGNRVAPYYVVKSAVETSSVVGASIEANLLFWPSWDNVVGRASVVSFDASIDIPLLPISIGTEVTMAIDDSGDFGGFSFSNDIIDVTFGFNGAFGIGYGYQSTYWITSMSDVKDAWDAIEDVADDAEDQIDIVIEIIDLLTDTLGEGGFLYTTDVPLTSSTNMHLSCPSSDTTYAGNSSSLNLGYIMLNEAIYGQHNFSSSETFCNSSTAYGRLYQQCQWLQDCDAEISIANLGTPECNIDYTSYTMDVIYTCPGSEVATVYNGGCYGASFWEVVDSNFIQDHSNKDYDFMHDNWEERENAIGKCSKIAADYGYDGFAMYNNGMCLVDKTLLNDGVYNRYNQTECPLDGKGDADSINIYIFATEALAFDDLGCYNVTYVEEKIGIENVDYKEKLHVLTQDDYKTRRLAVSKCAQIADEEGYAGFALLDGGACYMSDQFDLSNEDSIDNENGTSTFTCGTGRGDEDTYNVYYFPYATLKKRNSNKEELNAGEIAGISIGSVVFLICVGVGIFFGLKWWKNNYKPNKVQQKIKAFNKNDSRPPTNISAVPGESTGTR